METPPHLWGGCSVNDGSQYSKYLTSRQLWTYWHYWPKKLPFEVKAFTLTFPFITLHYITCKQLRRCSPIITFETQTALEQAKRTSLFLLSFWTWLKLKCPRSSQRKEVSNSGTTSLGRSFHWNSSGQEIDGWVPPPLSSAANKVTHSHFKTYEKPDLTGQSRKLKVVLLDCSKPWEDCALPATKLRCN